MPWPRQAQPTTDHAFAQVGFTGTADRFRSGLRPTLEDNQVVEIGFKIPIIDWASVAGR